MSSSSQAQLQQEASHAAVQDATNRALEGRKRQDGQSTTRQYTLPQRLWREWCEEKNFDDGEIVYEGKVLLWLEQVVLKRRKPLSKRTSHKKGKGKSKGKKKVAGEEPDERGVPPFIPGDEAIPAESYPEEYDRDQLDGDDAAPPLDEYGNVLDPELLEEGAPLTWGAIDGYLSAIAELYKYQVTKGTNKHPNYRGLALSMKIDEIKRARDQQNRENFRDRGAGGIQDGYSEEELLRLCQDLLHQSSKPEKYFRTRLDFLFGHYYVTRGETRRNAELADLCGLVLNKHEGVSECFSAVLTMSNGKTNKYGRMQFMGAIRHKILEVCPLNALAFYFFLRWHTAGEPFPKFNQRRDWYRIKVLKGHNRDVPIGYSTQLDCTHEAFKATGVSTRKVTHAFRPGGARAADLHGTAGHQIRRAGHWGLGVMEGAYMTGLPLKFMRAVAGFGKEQGSYFLSRGHIDVPDKLQHLVWPDLDGWLERIQRRNKNGCSYRQGGVDEQDLAAQGFLDLMKKLRIVFLQDAAVMQKSYPRLSIYQDPLFGLPEWHTFATLVQSAHEEQMESKNALLQRALPEVAQELVLTRDSMLSRIDSVAERIMAKVKHTDDMLRDMLTGKVPLYFGQPRRQLDRSVTRPVTPEPVVSSSVNRMELDSQLQEAAAVATFPQLNIQTPSRSRQKKSSQRPSAPTHELNTTVMTVPDAWREYKEGFCGGPAIESLERDWGAAWRPGQAARAAFSRRKVLLDEIERSSDVKAMVQALELKRQQKKWHLNKLQNAIKESRKVEGRSVLD